jgi:hypothetical protein
MLVAAVVVSPEQFQTGSVGFTSSKQIRHAAMPSASPVTCSEIRSRASEKSEVSASIATPPPPQLLLFFKPPVVAEFDDSKVSKVVKYLSRIDTVYCAGVWSLFSSFSPDIDVSLVVVVAKLVGGAKDQVAPPGRTNGIFIKY